MEKYRSNLKDVGKEWEEIPLDAEVGNDECAYFRKEEVNTYGR